MFLSRNFASDASGYPENSDITKSDWLVLAAMWHPVALIDEINENPRRFTLLDLPLVIFRASQGVTVARDICPHRGAPLSMGHVKEDRIICPYHGLEFAPDGTCVRIPAREDQSAPIAGSFNLITYRNTERYGLLWVCLKPEPIVPLPDWPILGNEKVMSNPDTTITINSEVWEVSAPRHVENFNDPAHLPFVHADTFGNPEDPRIPEFDVDITVPYVLRRVKLSRSEVRGIKRDFALVSELTLPFSSMLVDQEEDGRIRYAIHDVASPNSAYQSTIYQIAISECDDPRAHLDYMLQVNSEDIALVEKLYPKDYLLNIRNERHTHADACSVAYKKALVKLGLGVAEK